MPRGYRWDKGDRYERLEEQDDSMYFAVIMSVTFVFLLMGVLFESFVLPLSVLISIPFSFLGVYWTLYLTNTQQDIMSIIGMVILIGVVVNNAIVLIDLANRLRDEGMDRLEALMEAGRHRFRPILMTTFTTAFGLIPMAVGNSKLSGVGLCSSGTHYDRGIDGLYGAHSGPGSPVLYVLRRFARARAARHVFCLFARRCRTGTRARLVRSRFLFQQIDVVRDGNAARCAAFDGSCQGL